MIFEFIIVHRLPEDETILTVLRERLRETLEANLNEVEDSDLNFMIQINFQPPEPELANGAARAVLGFSLELNEETISIREVVDEFADSLIAPPLCMRSNAKTRCCVMN